MDRGGQISRAFCSVDRRASNSFTMAKLIVGGYQRLVAKVDSLI